MTEFNEFLESLENDKQTATMEAIFNWISETFPELETTVKWNQPMFTQHGTFIIAFSKSKQHYSIAPKEKGMTEYNEQIAEAGYSQINNLFRIKWTQDVNYELLQSIIQFNIEDKAKCTTFWRT